jgi:hypothetical protein
MNACINTNDPAFKVLAKRYESPVLAELLIYEMRKENIIDNNEIPSIITVKKFLKNRVITAEKTIDTIITNQQHLTEQLIKDVLQGIISKYKGQYYITQGNVTGIQSSFVINDVYMPHYDLMLRLQKKYPKIFEIVDTPSHRVKVIKLHEISFEDYKNAIDDLKDLLREEYQIAYKDRIDELAKGGNFEDDYELLLNPKYELAIKLQELFNQLYPAIKINFSAIPKWQKSTEIEYFHPVGQANIKAMKILIDENRQELDTSAHEYVHHYIAWFRNTPIVQEAIKKWGSEEKLVQAIGEQAVKQKGEAWTWWKEFLQWVITLFDNLSTKNKEDLKNILTDAFLTGMNLETHKIITKKESRELAKKTTRGIYNQERQYSQYLDSLNKLNTNPILQNNQQEQVKKFVELQERLNNKEFLEGAKNAFESSEELQNVYYDSLDEDKFEKIFNNLFINKIIEKKC